MPFSPLFLERPAPQTATFPRLSSRAPRPPQNACFRPGVVSRAFVSPAPSRLYLALGALPRRSTTARAGRSPAKTPVVSFLGESTRLATAPKHLAPPYSELRPPARRDGWPPAPGPATAPPRPALLLASSPPTPCVLLRAATARLV